METMSVGQVPDSVSGTALGSRPRRRHGRAAFSGPLDPDLGFHYGAPVSCGIDTVGLTVEIPPQVARHEGYETASLETGTVSLSA